MYINLCIHIEVSHLFRFCVCRESEVAEEYVENALKSFSEYFKLAPADEVASARAALQRA